MTALLASAQVAPPKPRPDTKFFNVLFKAPDPAEWRRVEKDEKLTFAAKAPKGEWCHITIMPGQTLDGDFPRAFDKAIGAHLKFLNTKIERDSGNQSSKAAEGFDVLQRVIVGKEKNGHTYHWFLGGHPGSRFDLLVYETSTEALWTQHRQEAAEFFYSVKLYSSLDADAINSLPENLRVQKLAAKLPLKPEPMPREQQPAPSPAQRAEDAVAEEASGLGAALKGLGKSAPPAAARAEPNMAAASNSTSTPEPAVTSAPQDKPAPTAAPATAQPQSMRPPAGSAAPADRPADPKPAEIGPVHVGDKIEVMLNGDWQPGTVTHNQQLTYFVHSGDGSADRFFHLHELRPAGGARTFAEMYHDKAPDPQGGPVAIGDTIEANVWNWVPCRVARRVADMYVVFPEDEKIRKLKPEAWVGPSEMRTAGSTNPLSQSPLPAPIKPLVSKDIRIGDHIEADMPGGYGWMEATVMASDAGKFYVQAAADSLMRGWVALDHLRPAGSKNPFGG